MKSNNLKRELEKVCTAAFTDKNAAFLAPLLCQLEVSFNKDISTARTNGTKLEFNPDFLLGLPMNERATILMHELWHVGRLHSIRCGARDPILWNYCCDAVINRALVKDGYSFNKIGGIHLKTDLSEEELYESLLPKWKKPKNYQPDIDYSKEGEEENRVSDVVNAVSNALQTAKLCGYSTNGLEELVERLLRPKLNWRTLLEKFFQDMIKEDYSWKRPNKRYQDIYLPFLYEEEKKLSHIMFFLDTSGSMTQEQFAVFLSELRYLKNEFQPEKLTIVMFDTDIHSVIEYKNDDSLSKLKVKGRGGTSYVEVADMIEKEKPICAVIFTDLYAEPMRKPKCSSEVIWVISDSDLKPPFGRYCYA